MNSRAKLIAVGDSSAPVCEDGTCALPGDSEESTADLPRDD